MSSLTTIILHKADIPGLKKRLQEVKSAEQVIVLDDPSPDSDEAKKLVKNWDAEFLQRSLNGDFAAQRNFALEHTTQDWTLFIDSDESVLPDLWEEVQKTIKHSNLNGAWIERRDIFLGKELKHGETGSMRLLRLGRTQLGKGKWERSVHETWQVAGPWEYLKTPLIHEPHQSFTEFLQKLNRYASFEPGNRKKLSRRKVVVELLTYPVAKFFKAILWQSGWQDGVAGWIHAFGMSYWSLCVRIYCWEAWYEKK